MNIDKYGEVVVSLDGSGKPKIIARDFTFSGGGAFGAYEPASAYAYVVEWAIKCLQAELIEQNPTFSDELMASCADFDNNTPFEDTVLQVAKVFDAAMKQYREMKK